MSTETKADAETNAYSACRPRKQQEIDAAVQKLRALRRRGVRTYFGLWGLAFDRVVNGAINVAQQGVQFSQSAEERGAEVEQTLRTQLSGLERQAITGLVWLRERIDEQLPAGRTTPAMPPTPDRVITASVPVLTPNPSSGAVLLDPAEARRIIAPFPLENYGQLMAKQVIDQLERLTVDELKIVQEYEQEQGARITVLRAIDQTLRRKLAIV